MNKEEIKDIMKNMDDKTVEKISADYSAGDDATKERIYKEIVRRMNNETDTAVSGDEVSGVETYRRRNITRIISAAAAFIIVAGAVGGGAYLMKDHKSKSPAQTSDEIVDVTTSEAFVTQITTEPITTVKTVEVTTSVTGTETAVTTTESAAVTTEPASSSEEQGNGAISKQELYDKCISNNMKSSVAYTAEIEEIYAECEKREYWVNSHPDYSIEDKIVEYYLYDGVYQPEGKSEYYYFSDNNGCVHIYDSREASAGKAWISVGVNGEPMGNEGPANILDAFGWYSMITPYESEYVLSDFSKWDIKCIENYLSRECAVIEGSDMCNESTGETIKVNYTIYVDIETGSWMKLSYNNESNFETTIEVKSLSIGDEAAPPVSKTELKERINKLKNEEGFELRNANDFSANGTENVDMSILDE